MAFFLLFKKNKKKYGLLFFALKGDSEEKEKRTTIAVAIVKKYSEKYKRSNIEKRAMNQCTQNRLRSGKSDTYIGSNSKIPILLSLHLKKFTIFNYNRPP